MPQNSKTWISGYVKINFLHPSKLVLQEVFLKMKLRKFLQKCSTPEKIIISSHPGRWIVCREEGQPQNL